MSRPVAGTRPRYLLGFHAVREAIRAGTPLRFMAVSASRRDARVGELLNLARASGVPVRFEPAAALDRWAAGLRHQGVVAEAEAKLAVGVEDLLRTPTHQLLLALDGIEDPQNLGAILRSACGAGVDGVILPARRSAGLTEAVDRVSAGALEHVRVARAGNLVNALETCRAAGWWITGLDAQAPVELWRHDFAPPTVLVVGAEGRGLHQLTQKRCDALVSIPLAAGVSSLNAAAAAAIVLFEVVRQRRRAG